MRTILRAGVPCGLTMVVWTFVVNGLLGLGVFVDMKQVPNERQVYEVLKGSVTEPGGYMCNPEPTADGRSPEGEPVFAVRYGGMGHEAAGRLALIGLVVFFLAPGIAVWMLSEASPRVLASFPRKVLFFTAIGLLLALLGDLGDFGIGGYPLSNALLLAANHVALWTVMGVVAAWRIRAPNAAT